MIWPGAPPLPPLPPPVLTGWLAAWIARIRLAAPAELDALMDRAAYDAHIGA